MIPLLMTWSAEAVTGLLCVAAFVVALIWLFFHWEE